MLTAVIPQSTIAFACAGVIISFDLTITSFVFGLTMSSTLTLPEILSSSFSITVLSSIKSVTTIPFGFSPRVSKQSTSLTTTSWATSTSLLVK